MENVQSTLQLVIDKVEAQQKQLARMKTGARGEDSSGQDSKLYTDMAVQELKNVLQ